MAFKTLIFTSFFCLAGYFSANAQNQDSVVYEVFNALTAEACTLPKNTDKLLNGHEWEALAYWDTQDAKVFENMHEAVGDIYQFIAPSFSITPVDPNNPAKYLTAITGSFTRENSILKLLATSSGKTLELKIVLLDHHYLILEIDGLRIFFTQTRSYH